MEIKIRQKPQRSTGKTSLVLEYYYGYTRDDEGRIKHRRKFETLEYYWKRRGGLTLSGTRD